MNADIQPWAVVLAAGSGNRLSSLTTNEHGVPVPKQYCSLTGGNTLLEDTIARARNIAEPARITAVVAAQHRAWWQPQLRSLPHENVIEQPHDRGTAVGIMLAALHIHQRDPNAAVVFLPSDHFVMDESIVADCLHNGLRHLAQEPSGILLLGITPEEIDTELGYIVPAAPVAERVYSVSEFVEKPDRDTAYRLLEAGSVWNSFIIVVRVRALLQLCGRRCGDVLERLRLALRRDDWNAHGGDTLNLAYECLPKIDFSKSVLAGGEADLRMLLAPCCGWTDLGTPARVGRCVEQLGAHWLGRGVHAVPGSAVQHTLARAYSRMSLAG